MSRSITHTRGHGGLETIVVTHPLAEGELCLHGAHVTHWKPAGAEPVLWMSPQAVFQAGQAIRGGVPICLPWFGPHATASAAPSHGLVRTRAWELLGTDEDADGVTVALRTRVAADDSPHWPHPFTAEFTARFGTTLTMALTVTNTGPQAFEFGEALHTYFRVRDVRQTRIGGLHGATYIDKTAGLARGREERDAIVMSEETDRVYVDTAAACVVQDPGLGRRIVVEKSGSESTVVWNPFPARAKALTDVGEANWPGFVCVESANCADNTLMLAAGATHTLRVTLRLEPSDPA